MFVCVCPALAPHLGDACACVVVVRFASGGTLQVDRRLLNYASTDLYKRSAQHLQEDAGRDDAWEASPTPVSPGRVPNGGGYLSIGAPRGPLESRVAKDPLPKHRSL